MKYKYNKKTTKVIFTHKDIKLINYPVTTVIQIIQFIASECHINLNVSIRFESYFRIKYPS